LSRQIFSQEAGEKSRAYIDAPTCGAADIDDDRLAFEIALGLGRGGRAPEDRAKKGGRREAETPKNTRDFSGSMAVEPPARRFAAPLCRRMS
jgi:hypothetical protein